MKIIQIISPNNPKTKGSLLLLLIFSFWFLVFGFSVYAVSPSPEASPTATEELDEKIQDIRNAVKEKVQEKLDEVKKGEKRAFVGEISDLTDSTVFLTTRSGEKQVKVNPEAEIIDQKRNRIEMADLEIGNLVIAMGYLEGKEILDAKRVAVISPPKVAKREVIAGQVTDISEENVLTVRNEKQGITYTVESSAKTKISQKVEGKMGTVKFSEVGLGDLVVTVGTPTENEEKIITAKIIHVIPGKTKDITPE